MAARCVPAVVNGRWRRWKSTTSTCWCWDARPTSATCPARHSCGWQAPGPSAPTCVIIRKTGAIHLLSTWDEGVPDDIPHENLYGISWNPMNTIANLQRIRRRVDRETCWHRCTFARIRAVATYWHSRMPSWSTVSWPCVRPGGSKPPRKSLRYAKRSGWPRRGLPRPSPNCDPGSAKRPWLVCFWRRWRPAV